MPKQSLAQILHDSDYLKEPIETVLKMYGKAIPPEQRDELVTHLAAFCAIIGGANYISGWKDGSRDAAADGAQNDG